MDKKIFGIPLAVFVLSFIITLFMCLPLVIFYIKLDKNMKKYFDNGQIVIKEIVKTPDPVVTVEFKEATKSNKLK